MNVLLAPEKLQIKLLLKLENPLLFVQDFLFKTRVQDYKCHLKLVVSLAKIDCVSVEVLQTALQWLSLYSNQDLHFGSWFCKFVMDYCAQKSLCLFNRELVCSLLQTLHPQLLTIILTGLVNLEKAGFEFVLEYAQVFSRRFLKDKDFYFYWTARLWRKSVNAKLAEWDFIRDFVDSCSSFDKNAIVALSSVVEHCLQRKFIARVATLVIVDLKNSVLALFKLDGDLDKQSRLLDLALQLLNVLEFHLQDSVFDAKFVQEFFGFLFGIQHSHLPNLDLTSDDLNFQSFLCNCNVDLCGMDGAVKLLKPRLLVSIFKYISFQVKRFGLVYGFETLLIVLLSLKTVESTEYSAIYSLEMVENVVAPGLKLLKSILVCIEQRSLLDEYMGYIPRVLVANLASRICKCWKSSIELGFDCNDNLLQLLLLLSRAQKSLTVLEETCLGNELFTRMQFSSAFMGGKGVLLYFEIIANFVQNSGIRLKKSIEILNLIGSYLENLLDIKEQGEFGTIHDTVMQRVLAMTIWFGADSNAISQFITKSGNYFQRLVELLSNVANDVCNLDVNRFELSVETQRAICRTLEWILRQKRAQIIALELKITCKLVTSMIQLEDKTVTSILEQCVFRILTLTDLVLNGIKHQGYDVMMEIRQRDKNVFERLFRAMESVRAELVGITARQLQYDLEQRDDLTDSIIAWAIIDPISITTRIINDSNTIASTNINGINATSMATIKLIWQAILNSTGTRFETLLDYLSTFIDYNHATTKTMFISNPDASFINALLGIANPILNFSEQRADSLTVICNNAKIYVSKQQLELVSSVFEAMLRHEYRESMTCTIEITDIEAQDFCILQIYMEQVQDWSLSEFDLEVDGADYERVIRWYDLANRYMVEEFESSILQWLGQVVQCFGQCGYFEKAKTVFKWAEARCREDWMVMDCIKACVQSLPKRKWQA
jgi:hypothetical protein